MNTSSKLQRAAVAASIFTVALSTGLRTAEAAAPKASPEQTGARSPGQ